MTLISTHVTTSTLYHLHSLTPTRSSRPPLTCGPSACSCGSCARTARCNPTRALHCVTLWRRSWMGAAWCNPSAVPMCCMPLCCNVGSWMPQRDPLSSCCAVCSLTHSFSLSLSLPLCLCIMCVVDLSPTHSPIHPLTLSLRRFFRQSAPAARQWLRVSLSRRTPREPHCVSSLNIINVTNYAYSNAYTYMKSYSSRYNDCAFSGVE